MPYIKQENRDELMEDNGPFPRGPGELNYVFTTLAHMYVEAHGLSYQTLNDVIGVLEACKLEFYRRKVVPYENIKIEENGDV